jgi:hypothetical protein
MTLFPKRYRVTVIGSDGLMHSERVDHILLLQPTAFLLKKKAKSDEGEARYFDTVKNTPVSKAEIEAR